MSSAPRGGAPPLAPLPIDAVLADVVERVRSHPAVVVEAPPGAGKTTRVPRALLDAAPPGGGELWVLEPRRLAARLAARRVADELGERVGGRVGYSVRFEDVGGPDTRIRFVTEGVLTRRLTRDPLLRGVDVVLLDEFHERHLQGDLALALLRRLQLGERPELRLVVMSATLDAGPIAAHLGGAPTVRSEGRLFDVDVEYATQVERRPLSGQVAGAVRRLVAEGLDGDVLVFLPDAAEIRRAREACADAAREAELALVALHGDLSPEEQDVAVRPAGRRKVVLSTNVAESSVTIDGVVAVIDSGLARVATHAPWSGLPMLRVHAVSRASAKQRAGRAGRTRPGRCLRLFTRVDFDARPEFDVPEVRRSELADTVLALRAGGVLDARALPWLEAPPEPALAAAEALLERLGAVEGVGRPLTELGRRMLRFPLHPRLSRVVVEAERLGVLDAGCTLAAVLSERVRPGASARVDLGGGPRGRGGPPGAGGGAGGGATCTDPIDTLDSLDDGEAGGGVAHVVGRVRSQLLRAAGRDGAGAPRPSGRDATRAALRRALLAGFPDRVARRRSPGSAELVLSSGTGALLADAHAASGAELLLALEAEDRREPVRIPGQAPSAAGAGARALVRAATPIEADWLMELPGDRVTAVREVLWNAAAERVDVVERLVYDAVVLEETRGSVASAPAEVSAELARQARAAGPRAFCEPEALEHWLARTRFLELSAPKAGIRAPDDAALDAALDALCEGRRSFAELRQARLVDALQAALTSEQRRLVGELAPERVVLPSGRKTRVEYEAGKPPWIASRIQDFFGLERGPAACGGAVPLVLHLLAPSGRPVQVTSDLAGFWERHYPAVRRELMRKYPRHKWPEDPRRKWVDEK